MTFIKILSIIFLVLFSTIYTVLGVKGTAGKEPTLRAILWSGGFVAGAVFITITNTYIIRSP